MNTVQHPLEITRVNRALFKHIINQHTVPQLNTIPDGFSNNLIWNIAHTIVVQQVLVYGLSGLPTNIDQEMISRYKKGTKPEADIDQTQIEKIKNLLFTTIDKTENDLKIGIFKEFQEYKTSTGFVIKSVQDAIHFNNYHEGIHLGYILALKKSV